MASLLLVTQDVLAAQEIEQTAHTCGFRTRIVSTVEAAQEWLSMQTFTVLLVDSRFSGHGAIDLLAVGWRYNPLLIGGVFNLQGREPNEWNARLIGANVFSGPNALDAIKRCLQSAPGTLAFAESSYYGVLVVDDLDAPRDIICAYIESLGYSRVDAAGSAKEALAVLRKEPYEYFCVVSDINMPHESGIDLLRQIRADALISWLPVVFLTAFSTGENLIECIKEGASGFLTKPTKKPLLRAELEKAKRIVLQKQSPRLCRPEEAYHLEDALLRRGEAGG